jgi:hypothetical protein
VPRPAADYATKRVEVASAFVQVRAALLFASLSLFGCAAQRPNVHTVWLRTYGFGAFGGGDLDVRDVCQSGVADQLSVGSTWATLGISVATLGVYTPREARVRCVPR